MATKITYHERKASIRPTFETVKYGNLLSDTYQGQVELGSDGTWSGWFLNWSNKSGSKFKLGFGSRAAAARWVNEQLRLWGVESG